MLGFVGGGGVLVENRVDVMGDVVSMVDLWWELGGGEG